MGLSPEFALATKQHTSPVRIVMMSQGFTKTAGNAAYQGEKLQTEISKNEKKKL